MIRAARAGAELALGSALLFPCLAAAAPAGAAAPAHTPVPRMDHVIVIVMENRSFAQARPHPNMARLAASGAVFTNSFAVGHPSLPNYLALWAGSTLGVTNNDCPPPGAPFHSANLGQACETAGLTWRAYCESLPAPGDSVCWTTRHGYQKKHAPWAYFSNLRATNARPFRDFARDVKAGKVPNLVFLIPDQCNCGHDSCDLPPLVRTDRWLGEHMDLIRRAAGPCGLIVLTWDEDDYSQSNQVLTVFAGPAVRAGYSHAGRVTHYTILRTICDCLGLPPMNEAARESPIDDVWLTPFKGKSPTK